MADGTGGLTWTVLGAGTAAPHQDRTPSGHLLRSPGATILFDMGPGTLWRLAAAGVDWAALDAIFITHAHLDHTLDLQALMFAANIPGHGRTAPLPIVLSPKCFEYVERVAAAQGKWFVPRGFEVRWHTQEIGDVGVGDVTVSLGPVEHHETSVGMRVTCAGRRLAYTGDSALCDPLIDLCRDVDLAIVECSTLASNPAPGHMTPPDVAEVGRRSGARALAIVHRYPELDGVDLASAIARAGYGGEVTVCGDGQTFTLQPPTEEP